MPDNIIRKDVISVEFDTNYTELNKANDALDDLKQSIVGDLDKGVDKLTDGMDDLKKSVIGVGKSDGIDKLKDDIKGTDATTKKAKSSLKDFAESAKKIAKTNLDSFKNGLSKVKSKLSDIAKTNLEKLKNGLTKVKTKLTEIGKKAGGAALTGLKKLAGITFKGLTVGLGASVTAIGALVGKSVTAYAEYEQLIGGVETLFGAKGAKNVEEYAKITGKSVKSVKKEYGKLKEVESLVTKNANNAYKEAGLSANEYMNSVTSFSASLISSCGGNTKKAAELAHVAMVDMSDNANKMGSDMDSIIQTYQSLARGNFAMLDNLKLGYGGTKEELKRLIKDASKWDKSVKKNDTSYANIVKAIHAVQEHMSITGTTAKEAEHTISGSLSSLKSAWGNLMPALIQGGDSFDQCVDNLVSSAKTFGKNIMPAIKTALSGVGDLITELAPIIEKEFPTLVDELLPPLITAGTSLLKGLIKALPSIIKTIAKEIPTIFKEIGNAMVEAFGDQFPIVQKIGDVFNSIGNTLKDNTDKISKSIPIILAIVGAFKAFKGLSFITSIFGSIGSKGGSKGGLFSGITNTFKSLAKTKPTTILKGIANLGIILGGFIGLSSIVMAIAPYMAKLSDGKSLVKVIGVTVALGAVGSVLTNFSQIAGKIPVTTVVKGLANMAIMIGGLTVLTAAFMLVAPYIAKLSDAKSIVKVVAVITTLGILGTALSVLAGITGMIPIMAVVKGLANMAIVLVGMTALTAAFMLVAPKIAKLSDGKSILKVISIITILGGLGTVLSIFAGIAGMIPIPVVLAGLANIALVLGGITALIAAYGALSQIKGFNEFITKGGVVLSNIFNVIGKCVGSIIGGLGEGLTNSLPKIGENLANFAKSIKPMFTMFSGADMSGIGTFFKAMGAFMLQMAGEKILNFFTGGTDFAGLGTQLNTFATNSKGFFTTVAKLPENGFKNATLLFQSLKDIGNVPNTGGIAQWFSGTNDFEALANGLGQLSSAKVIAFYRIVSNLPQKGFENAKTLFQSLGDISNIPNTGGFGQWFSGTNDYEALANGLSTLSSAKVIGFYRAVSKLPNESFENTKKFFQSLKDIGNIPNKGGVAQWFSGENDFTGLAEGLSVIGDELQSFGEKTKSFFAQINNLKLSNLNGLWNSLKKAETVTANISEVVGNKISEIVKKISELPKKMGQGLKKAGGSLSDSLVSIWKDAVKASAKPVNKLIDGANWILKEFGSNKSIATWTPYAKGTTGHKGGNALVNDGRGAELVQMPNGKSFIPKGKNVFIPNAPKGMKVLPAEKTAQLMGKKSPTFSYANGTGTIDIWNYIDNPTGLINSVSDKYVTYEGATGIGKSIGKGMVTTIKGQMSSWAKKLYDEFGALSLAAYNPSKGVEQWKSTVIRALKMEGQYSAANVARTLFQMQTESGGNPRAINLWDSNAKKGVPSKGLMQVIDPTFKAYARAGFDKNIYDPLSNILASIRYAVARYGTLAKAYRGVGYANGGFANKPSIFGEDGLEAAIPLSRSKRKQGIGLWQKTGEMLGLSVYTPEKDSQNTTRQTVTVNNTYAPEFNLTISGTSDERSLKRKIKQWISEAMDETFESIGRTNNVDLQEV